MNAPSYRQRSYNRPEDRKSQKEQNARRVYKLLTGSEAPTPISISEQGDQMRINGVVVPKPLILFIKPAQRGWIGLIDSREVGNRFDIQNARKAYEQITGKSPSDPITLVYEGSRKSFMHINDILVEDKDLVSSILKDDKPERDPLPDVSRPKRPNQFLPLYYFIGLAAIGYYIYRRRK